MHHRSPIEHWKMVRRSKKMVKQAVIEEIVNDHDARPFIEIKLEGIEISGLLDSGASISCVGKEAFKTLFHHNIKWKEISSRIQTASGQCQNIEGYADVTIEFKNKSKKMRLYVIPSLSQKLYLGIDFWTAFDLMPKLDEITECEPQVNNNHILDEAQIKILEIVKEKFPSCVKEGLGKTTVLKHKIDVGNAIPIKHRYHAVSPAIQHKMFEEVDRMLELGVIEESLSPWSSPVTMVT